MKKIIGFVLALVCLFFSLCSCGNEDIWGIGNFTFTHVAFSFGGETHCATVEKWIDNDRGIELKTKEYGSIFCSEGTYILIESKENCPCCH